MVTEGEDDIEKRIVLTSPLSLEGDQSETDYRAPNLIHRIFSLLNTIRPGSDLTRFKLPPLFNIPKSQLQCYGESVYCVGDDLLSKCANGRTPIERFTSVIAWSISTLRPLMFGVAPYNPILGETHHVSRGSLNVLLEQVSHHPPVSALHATNENDNIEMVWCQYAVPKFYGTKIEAEVQGKRELKLLSVGETYLMNSPNLVIRFFPIQGVDWVGNVTIQCQESGLVAELCYKGSIFGRSNRKIRGKIFMSTSLKTIYEISGHWDRIVTMKDISNGKVTVIHNAKEVLSELKTPIVKDPKGLCGSESAIVWGEVSRGILTKSWEKASEAKTSIEETERELVRQRKSKGENWIPKHFTLSYTKDTGWECLPIQTWVPPAPIIVPI
ncbi:hypothetical protein LguiA_025983 [Lonicera macranthoides]